MKSKVFQAVSCVLLLAVLLSSVLGNALLVSAENDDVQENGDTVYLGGGYAASGQIDSMGYMTKLYDVSNGMLTSDANYLLCASDGSVWIGGYCGILRYDGSAFTNMT